MLFDPKHLKDIFTPELEAELMDVVTEYHGPDKKFYYDDISEREVRRSRKLAKFNEALEPLAREVFNDPSLKATYSIILTYDAKSYLVGHHDTNANIYTINYCVKSNVEWPIYFGADEERIGLDIPEGEALAFMGCDDFHYREETDQEDADLILIMFHFCPSDHWYFDKGEGHFEEIQDHFEIIGVVRKEAEDLEWIRDNESEDLTEGQLLELNATIEAKRQELADLHAMHDRIRGMVA
jgi:hypothetical protein